VKVTARIRTLALAGALAALLAALVAAALLGVERPDEAGRARREAGTRALPFRPDDVVGLVIQPRGGAAVRVERAGDGFRLISPDAGEASAAAVLGLLDRLAAVRVRARQPADPASLSSRGLDPPLARVTVIGKGGGSAVLDLGDETPFDRNRFGRMGGEILVLEDVPAALLDPAPHRLLGGGVGG
jgi:hypothetical protein